MTATLKADHAERILARNLLAREVTLEELAELLEERRGAEFVSFTAATRPRLLKKGRESGDPCPVADLLKVSRVLAILGFRYERSVQNQLEREGLPAETFEAKPRPWGEHRGGCLIEHKGKLFLEAKVERSIDHTSYDDQRKTWTGFELAEFLPTKKGSGRQGTEKAVILRDYSLENIREIRMGGETLTVKR